MLNNNTQTPANNSRKSSKFTMRNIMTVIGLTAFFVVAMFGVLIAQRQAQNPSEPVAPNAPASRPAASEPEIIQVAANCALGFTIAGPSPTNPAVTITTVQPSVTPTVPPNAKIVCQKVAEGATNLKPGSEFNYSIKVTAQTTTTGDFSFKDELPPELKWVRNVSSNTVSFIAVSEMKNGKLTDTITGFIDDFNNQSGEKIYTFRVRVRDDAAPRNNIVNTAVIAGVATAEGSQCAVNISILPSGTAQCTSKEVFRAPYTTGNSINGSVVEIGEELEYRLTIQSNQQTAGEVIIVDDLPTQVTYVPNSVKVNGIAYNGSALTVTGNKITLNLGGMSGNNAAETKVVSFRATVKTGAAVGPITNTATLTTGGSNADDCSSTVNIPPNGVAMCVSKNAYASFDASEPMSYSDGVNPGQKFYYKSVVRAESLTRGTVIFSDVLPADVTFIGGAHKTPEGLEYNESNRTVSYTFDKVEPGKDQLIAFEVQVKANAKPANPTDTLELKNVAFVTTTGTSQNPAPSCENKLQIPPQGTAICENKTAYTSYAGDTNAQQLAVNQAVNPGEEFFYRLMVKSADTTKGTIVVTDVLPAALEFSADVSHNTAGVTINAATNTATITLPAMSANATQVVEFKVKVKAGAAVGSFTNTATVVTASDTANDDDCTHSLTVPPRGTAQCQMKEAYTTFTSNGGVKIANESVINPFQEFVYKLTMKATEQTAGVATVVDVLPAVLEYIASTDAPIALTHANLTDGRTQLTATIPQFGASETKAIEFKVRVKDNGVLGDISNQASVTTAGVTGGTPVYCTVKHTIPAPICNQGCSTDAQCQQANVNYVCDSASKTCRLDSNRGSASCTGLACNGDCSANADCAPLGDNFFCSTEYGKKCRIKANPGAANCQLQKTQPTPTPAIGCNDVCTSNADCSNPDHICSTDNGGRCRLDTYPNSSSCSIPSNPGTYPPPVGAQPTLPAELPQSGFEDWAEWLKAGVVILGLGGLLLLLL